MGMVVMKDNTWKYGNVKLSSMTYTFKCDNEKCKKSIISNAPHQENEPLNSECALFTDQVFLQEVSEYNTQ